MSLLHSHYIPQKLQVPDFRVQSEVINRVFQSDSSVLTYVFRRSLLFLTRGIA